MSTPSPATDPIRSNAAPANGPATGAARPRWAVSRTGLPASPGGEGARDVLFAALGEFGRCEADLFWFLVFSCSTDRAVNRPEGL
jgi:hypothetical protein